MILHKASTAHKHGPKHRSDSKFRMKKAPQLLIFTMFAAVLFGTAFVPLQSFTHSRIRAFYRSRYKPEASNNDMQNDTDLLGAFYVPDDSSGSLDSRKTPTATASIVSGDTRVEATKLFLKDYNSPMYPYAHIFVREADKYGLDWRLVVAISGVESAFGQYVPTSQEHGYSYNAWGWAGNKDRSVRWSYFDGWSDGIATVTKGLALGYGTDLTPYEIVPSYCPDCVEGNGPWPDAVSHFMVELASYEQNVRGG